MAVKIYNDRNCSDSHLQEGVMFPGKGGQVGKVNVLYLYMDSISCHKPQHLSSASGISPMFICFLWQYFSSFFCWARWRQKELLTVTCFGTVEWILNFGRSIKNPTQPVSCSRREDERCLILPFISPFPLMEWYKKNTVPRQRSARALGCDNESDCSVGNDLLLSKVPSIIPPPVNLYIFSLQFHFRSNYLRKLSKPRPLYSSYMGISWWKIVNEH